MAVSCELFYTVVDAKNNKSRMTFPCTVPEYTDIPLVAVALAELLDPMINGGIENAGWTMSVDLGTVNAIAAATSDVQEGARFVFKTALGFLKSVRLPAVVETIFATGSPDVDLTDTDVMAFNSCIVDGLDTAVLGGSVGLASFGTTRYEDLTTLVTATEDWGKNR